MKKQFPLLPVLLVLSSLVVGALGTYLKYEILQPLELYQQESIFAIPFMLMADDTAKYTLVNAGTADTVPLEPATEPPLPVVCQPEPVIPETQPPETEPEPTEPVIVDESWFNDVLFIGDSRTKGMENFGRLGEADYFCSVGLTVYSAQSRQLKVKGYGKKIKLEKLLSKKTYGKIYINLGLNEIMGIHDKLIAKYQELIDLIRKKQPDAVIILQGIMTVGRQKAEQKACFMPENIMGLNERIAALVEGDNMRYIDVNEWIADEEGYLPDDWTKDGCHPYATGYAEWSQWILENAGTLGIE